jgi:4-hydroxy-tetrahydrodipicolinate reductase
LKSRAAVHRVPTARAALQRVGAPRCATRTRAPRLSNPITRVIVAGATGRVGQAMLSGLPAAGLEVVGGFGSANAHTQLTRLAPSADVLVDFTTGQAAPALLLYAAEVGLRIVSGTTGLPTSALDEVDEALREKQLGGVWAANFAIGAVLMMHFARTAARFMAAAEVIELHHDKKVDAPSGTAVQTARQIRAARDADLPDPAVKKWTLEGSRGAVEGGVRVHSVRLPGLNAHQEVLFGSLGQVLSIRHDALGRDAYVPGVAMAIEYAGRTVGLTRGLDTLMGLP